MRVLGVAGCGINGVNTVNPCIARREDHQQSQKRAEQFLCELCFLFHKKPFLFYVFYFNYTFRLQTEKCGLFLPDRNK